MGIARAVRLTGTVFLAAAGGCAGPGPSTVTASTAAAVRWTEPPAYTYVLTTGCTRGFVDARYRVVVRDGEVVSSTALNQQATAHPQVEPPTLGLLDTWITGRDPANHGLRRDRDPADGRPAAFGFDPAASAVDAGECYAVSEYAVS